MNTILVWVLVTMGSSYSGMMTYSPAMATLEECTRIKSIIDADKESLKYSTRCIQMHIVK